MFWELNPFTAIIWHRISNQTLWFAWMFAGLYGGNYCSKHNGVLIERCSMSYVSKSFFIEFVGIFQLFRALHVGRRRGIYWNWSRSQWVHKSHITRHFTFRTEVKEQHDMLELEHLKYLIFRDKMRCRTWNRIGIKGSH